MHEPDPTSRRPANRLAGATSPYLLQHAHNPVDWYEWGDEALARARREDKPLLVSIGYAACHWCHVMERESFEDHETAEDMNANFVCVKVDREERPDVDAIYMEAVQAMSGHGGWPMTVFCSPDGTPFFAGTYFPNEPRHGMLAFRDVLAGVAEAWRERRHDVAEQGARVLGAIDRTSALRPSVDPLSEEVLRSAFDGTRRSFDPDWGGFGGAPKFPQPMNVEFVLRCALRGYDGAREMATTTLDRMVAGGMYDHVGGGFHRYSVDGRWHVPHFEKMLYDNAQLALAYLHAYQLAGTERYRLVVVETLQYLLREMRHTAGGFSSSQDADSEGEEGRFYVWPWDELVQVVGQDVARWYGATPSGNWEGANVLWVPDGAGVAPSGLEEGRRALFERREIRVRPATDDKVLAGWNGLAISAFAEGGRVLGEPYWIEAAERAAEFVLTYLRRDDGRLVRAWRDGRTAGPAYADDHALVARALLDLYETTFDPRWFTEARRVATDLVRLFADQEGGGGFFQTGSDAEALVVRPKELFDNALPSGNSAAAEVLLRLALLTGDPEIERAALSALRLVRDLMERAPLGFGRALCALDLSLGPSREVAIVGDPHAADTQRMVHEVRDTWRPNTVVAVAAATDGEAIEAVELLRDRPEVDGVATAYVCERFACQRPTTSPEELREQLRA
jgi:uncharacterized protein YyaL (SSP411 family)